MANLDIIYRIAADITGLKDGVDKAASATEGLDKTVQRAGKTLAASFSVEQVIAFGKVTTAAYGEQEAALKKLETALTAQGQATPDVIQQYDDLAATFQKTTAYSDDLILEMEALLVQVGNVMPDQMDAALKAATDLSSGLGIDLRAATLLVGKAFEGETGTLKKYGIVIDETKLQTEGASAVLEGINQKFGGQAQAEIQTYAGHVKQFNNRMNEGQESIGGFLASGLTPLMDTFAKLPEPLQTVASAIAGLTPNLGNLALALAVMGPAGIAATGTAVMAGLGAVLVPLATAVAVVGTAILAWRLGTWIGEVTGATNAIEWMTGKLMGLTTEQINASRAARQHAEDVDLLKDSIDRATKALPKLTADVARQTTMSADEVKQTIKDMDAALEAQNAKRKEAEAAREKEAKAEAARQAEYVRLLNETRDLDAAAAREKAEMRNFLGLREMQDAADEYARGEKQRADEKQRAAEKLAEAQQLETDILVAEMNASQQHEVYLQAEHDAWKGHLSAVGDAFVELSQVAGGSLSSVSRGIGTLFKGIEGLGSSITSLKGGFGSLGSGDTMKGIASIAGGISGIIGMATAAIQAVKALWNWAHGGEEGQVVNPARDQFFAAHGGLAGVNEAAYTAQGNLSLTEAIFGASTKSEFDAATSAWERATGGTAMAAGGLVTQPTFAMLGEAGPELVTPLSALGGLGGEIVIHTVLNVDGRAIARSTARHLPGVLATQGIPT